MIALLLKLFFIKYQGRKEEEEAEEEEEEKKNNEAVVIRISLGSPGRPGLHCATQTHFEFSILLA